ncbi:type II toxin-antitoxin system HicA family toxin [Spirulina subsalsa]|uniref:type II toxin-antitoxin system HicA family toxin n=1 Tax=Spirulina subsalsa TaxID=54311 RepID=UPI0038B32216
MSIRESHFRYGLLWLNSYGKGDHCLYIRVLEKIKRIVPIDMGAKEMSPSYILRIFRQFGFTDEEIDNIIK